MKVKFVESACAMAAAPVFPILFLLKFNVVMAELNEIAPAMAVAPLFPISL